jgi:hypothetical protein
MTTPRPIGFWLKLVDRLIDDQFATTLDEHGVTRRQWQLLNVLSGGPATVAELDAALAPFLAPAVGDREAESVAENLTELIDSAWVDATHAGYELTPKGSAALARLSAVVAEQRTQVARGISDAEYLATVDVLERAARNLGWTDTDQR